MTFRMWADETKPVPRPVYVRVTCDSPRHLGTLFGPPTAAFNATSDHPREPAIRAGWKITADGEVLCPECNK